MCRKMNVGQKNSDLGLSENSKIVAQCRSRGANLKIWPNSRGFERYFAVFCSFSSFSPNSGQTPASKTVQFIGIGSTPSTTSLFRLCAVANDATWNCALSSPRQHIRFGVFENTRSYGLRIREVRPSLSRSFILILSRLTVEWRQSLAANVSTASRPQWPLYAYTALPLGQTQASPAASVTYPDVAATRLTIPD